MTCGQILVHADQIHPAGQECRIDQIHPAGQESVEWEVDDRNFASIGVMETADVGEKVELYKRIPMKV